MRRDNESADGFVHFGFVSPSKHTCMWPRSRKLRDEFFAHHRMAADELARVRTFWKYSDGPRFPGINPRRTTLSTASVDTAPSLHGTVGLVFEHVKERSLFKSQTRERMCAILSIKPLAFKAAARNDAKKMRVLLKGLLPPLSWQSWRNDAHLALHNVACLLYTSPSPRDGLLSRMPSSA